MAKISGDAAAEHFLPLLTMAKGIVAADALPELDLICALHVPC